MKTIGATEFKARCLQIMDDVETRRTEVVITKRGRPVAKLVPVAKPRRKSVFGCLKHLASLDPDADFVSPITPPEDWKYPL